MFHYEFFELADEFLPDFESLHVIVCTKIMGFLIFKCLLFYFICGFCLLSSYWIAVMSGWTTFVRVSGL